MKVFFPPSFQALNAALSGLAQANDPLRAYEGSEFILPQSALSPSGETSQQAELGLSAALFAPSPKPKWQASPEDERPASIPDLSSSNVSGRRGNIQYLESLFAALRSLAAAPHVTRLPATHEVRAAIGLLLGGVGTFLRGADQKSDEAIMGMVEMVSAQFVNAALGTIIGLSGVAFPNRPDPFAARFFDFDYHPLSGGPVYQAEGYGLERGQDYLIEEVSQRLADLGVPWYFRFKEWIRSLYLLAGNPGCDTKRIRSNLSHGLERLLNRHGEFPSGLAPWDIRRVLGTAAMAVGRPLPGLESENWPRELDNDIGNAAICIFDAGVRQSQPQLAAMARRMIRLWTHKDLLNNGTAKEVEKNLRSIITGIDRALRSGKSIDIPGTNARLDEVEEVFQMAGVSFKHPPSDSMSSEEWVKTAEQFLSACVKQWNPPDGNLKKVVLHLAATLRGEGYNGPRAEALLKLLFQATLALRHLAGISEDEVMRVAVPAERLKPEQNDLLLNFVVGKNKEEIDQVLLGRIIDSLQDKNELQFPEISLDESQHPKAFERIPWDRYTPYGKIFAKVVYENWEEVKGEPFERVVARVEDQYRGRWEKRMQGGEETVSGSLLTKLLETFHADPPQADFSAVGLLVGDTYLLEAKGVRRILAKGGVGERPYVPKPRDPLAGSGNGTRPGDGAEGDAVPSSDDVEAGPPPEAASTPWTVPGVVSPDAGGLLGGLLTADLDFTPLPKPEPTPAPAPAPSAPAPAATPAPAVTPAPIPTDWPAAAIAKGLHYEIARKVYDEAACRAFVALAERMDAAVLSRFAEELWRDRLFSVAQQRQVIKDLSEWLELENDTEFQEAIAGELQKYRELKKHRLALSRLMGAKHDVVLELTLPQAVFLDETLRQHLRTGDNLGIFVRRLAQFFGPDGKWLRLLQALMTLDQHSPEAAKMAGMSLVNQPWAPSILAAVEKLAEWVDADSKFGAWIVEETRKTRQPWQTVLKNFEEARPAVERPADTAAPTPPPPPPASTPVPAPEPAPAPAPAVVSGIGNDTLDWNAILGEAGVSTGALSEILSAGVHEPVALSDLSVESLDDPADRIINNLHQVFDWLNILDEQINIGMDVFLEREESWGGEVDGIETEIRALFYGNSPTSEEAEAAIRRLVPILTRAGQLQRRIAQATLAGLQIIFSKMHAKKGAGLDGQILDQRVELLDLSRQVRDSEHGLDHRFWNRLNILRSLFLGRIALINETLKEKTGEHFEFDSRRDLQLPAEKADRSVLLEFLTRYGFVFERHGTGGAVDVYRHPTGVTCSLAQRAGDIFSRDRAAAISAVEKALRQEGRMRHG